jgi:hypothetical protein
MSASFSVVCWLWTPSPDYRSQFGVTHVNILRNMVERHFKQPHEFVCISDQTKGFHSSIRVIPLWNDLRDLKSIYGPNTPCCYPRLKAYSQEMGELIGPRFVSVDLDAVVSDDLTPVWCRPEDFVIWGDRARQTPYNGSMWMMNAGARSSVWEKFIQNPEKAIAKARGAGFYGSDQAWMCYSLGKQEARWTTDDGVFSYRTHVKNEGGRKPKGARITFFQGHYDPWSPRILKQCPWVQEDYR